MSINVRQTQMNLKAAGFDPMGLDGVPGDAYYVALLAFGVKRQPDPTLAVIASVMATQLSLYGWDRTPTRLAEWIAQTSNETGGYKAFQENMRYSAVRLTQVWPNRFPTVAAAQPYAWDPSDPDLEDVALANATYGGRMGNQLNGTADNDGWDHRGGGLVQHTGAAEYETLARRLGFTPDDVRDPAKAVIAACDYLARAKTQSFVDANNFSASRKSVNGGLIGLDDIAGRRARLLSVIT